MKTYVLQVFALLFCLTITAQNDTDILLNVNEEAITVAEFKKVYLKNIELLQDESKKDPESYLDLFIPYKLKVQEAYTQGLDTNETYIKELSGYKKQLAKTFLTDVSITDKLVKEAYDRSVNEINARHILVRVAANASPADTLTAYSKITEARTKILEGGDFESIAKEYSDDPSAKVNGGELGWFKAFKMVYPFEKAAYGTTVGEVSMPFSTSFGYHIVQTTGTRKAQGAVQVAHIMILNEQKDATVNPKERIDQIYGLLQNGEDFASLAKTYSDDKNTAQKGGAIRKFERGEMSSTEFENAAFALENIGDYSEPFQSKFGWHIALLKEKFPVQSFEEAKGELESRVKRDKRSQVISEALLSKLRKRYNQEDISAVVALVDDKAVGDFTKDKWVYTANPEIADKAAFILKDSTYTIHELAQFLERSYNPRNFANNNTFFKESTRRYIDLKTQAYHEEHLEELEPEFAAVLRKYKEGLLIFDLMDQEIWGKAKTDSLGLQSFYESKKTQYKEAKKAVATVYTSQDKAALATFRKGLEANAEQAIEAIPETILKTTKDLFIKEVSSYASGYKPAKGISEVLSYNNGYVLYDVSEIAPERIKTLDEVRGIVISDYQQYLETTWIDTLKSNANITINKKVLKKLTKQFD